MLQNQEFIVLLVKRFKSLQKTVQIQRWIRVWWSGQLEGEEMKEVVYEGYGPNGSALLIKTITSNTNRTSQTVRTALQKAGGSMAEIGAVAWQFKEQGVIVIDGILEIVEDKGRQLEKITPFNAEELELQLMELAIEDLSIEDGVAEVTTSKSDFITVRSQISELWYHIAEADIHYIADNQVSLSGEDLEIFEKIVDAINEDEDVDHLYHNVAL